MTAGEAGITLRMHAKDGTRIDAGEIEKCLDHTVAKIADDDEAGS